MKVSCTASGSWDVLPSEAWEFCAGNDVMIKFGLGLLRVPEYLPLRQGVLSYHHGDPRRYRGRPAGFYEMANHEPVMGVIVQRLSNVLDGGDVLAEAKSPIYPHTYRATLTDAYRSGVPLLGAAVRNLSTDRRIGLDALGTNYSLPNNAAVAKFVAQQAAAWASRVAYGAFRQKAWQVGYSATSLNLTGGDTVIASSEINRTPTQKPYAFLADPCSADPQGIFCEAMPASGKGKIVRLSGGSVQEVNLGGRGKHFSYPQTVYSGASRYLFPEVASHNSPCLYELEDQSLRTSSQWKLTGLETERILDGTLFEHLDRWYLFGQRADEPMSIARLWHSEGLFERWQEHDDSPIAIDPRRARMAGPILKDNGKLFRLTQDSSGGYGAAMTVNQIESISSEAYAEKFLGRISIDGWKGPHTLTASSQGGYWLDCYRDVWSARAGVSRLRGRFGDKR